MGHFPSSPPVGRSGSVRVAQEAKTTHRYRREHLTWYLVYPHEAAGRTVSFFASTLIHTSDRIDFSHSTTSVSHEIKCELSAQPAFSEPWHTSNISIRLKSDDTNDYAAKTASAITKIATIPLVTTVT